MGNIELPRNASPGDINEWEKAFFDGACNGHIAPKLQGIEPYELWKAIEGKTEFPKEISSPAAPWRTSSSQQRKGGRHGHKSKRPSYPGTIPHHYGAQVPGPSPVSVASNPPPDGPRWTLHRYLAALRSFRRCLWFADRDLPYGEVTEVDDFSRILRDPQ